METLLQFRGTPDEIGDQIKDEYTKRFGPTDLNPQSFASKQDVLAIQADIVEIRNKISVLTTTLNGNKDILQQYGLTLNELTADKANKTDLPKNSYIIYTVKAGTFTGKVTPFNDIYVETGKGEIVDLGPISDKAHIISVTIENGHHTIFVPAFNPNGAEHRGEPLYITMDGNPNGLIFSADVDPAKNTTNLYVHFNVAPTIIAEKFIYVGITEL